MRNTKKFALSTLKLTVILLLLASGTVEGAALVTPGIDLIVTIINSIMKWRNNKKSIGASR